MTTLPACRAAFARARLRFGLVPTDARRAGMLSALSLITALALSGCGKDAGGGHGGAQMQMPPAQVSVITVEPADLPVEFVHTGQTTASREVEIRARVSGILEKRMFTEGSSVKQGQALAEIDPAPFRARVALAQAELAQARAQATQDERRAKRVLALLDDRVVSTQDADNARSAVELSKAAVQAAQARLSSAQLDLSYTTVRAPLNGRIGRALKSEGALLDTATNGLIATLAQLDPIYVEFSVPENDRLARAALIAAKQLEVPEKGYSVALELADGRIAGRTGQIDFTDYRADPQTGGFAMRAAIANPDASLLPGQFVRVHLRGAVRRAAIAIPQRAVLDGPNGKFVYLMTAGKDGGQIAQPHPIVVGPWIALSAAAAGADADGWLIESGLARGDRVIVEGAGKLRPMQPVAPLEAGAGPKADAPPAGKS